jgi:tetratricopeptide (TPR) repeat protein
MRFWIHILCLITFVGCLASHDCSCGIPESDRNYSQAVSHLIAAVKRAGMFHFRGLEFPSNSRTPVLKYSNYPLFCEEGIIQWDYCTDEWNPTLERDLFCCYRHTEWRHPSDTLDILEEVLESGIIEGGPALRVESDRFVLTKDYTAIPRAFAALKRDCAVYYESTIQFFQRRLTDMEHGHVFDGHYCGWSYYRYSAKDFTDTVRKLRTEFSDISTDIHMEESKAFANCKVSLDNCLKHHDNPLAHYQRGLFDFLEGRYCDALDNIQLALNRMDVKELEKLQAELAFLKGQTESEVGLYLQAVASLTEAIELNPSNKEAYFERAVAHFESGQFDLAIIDYLASEMKSQPVEISAGDRFIFAMGLSEGILKGAADSAIDFIPNMLTSAHGLSYGLWALATHPLHTSRELIDGAYACINFIRHNSSTKVLCTLVPELQELVKNWTNLTPANRGELTGYVIGKYGVDIFLGTKAIKCVTAYRDLKKATSLLTFETAARSEQNAAAIATAAKGYAENRKLFLEKSNFIIKGSKHNLPQDINFTTHALHRARERGVSGESVLDTLTSPLKIEEVRIDNLGRPSQRFIGTKAEVVINPETQQVVSVNPTSTKKSKKLSNELRNVKNRIE